ncbi:nucleotidyltransferase family protein [Herbiconiux sp. 11R-BC]|uniref:nucleotidyltransferase family protein n=1 Tax=Herbiconiux sp. 11R-BC TaxID=3111637 RepID=UPI003C0DAB90
MTPPAPDAPIVGLLLAAGAGTRMGRPKALVADPETGEPWLRRAVRTLQSGGCAQLVVVLGAEAQRAAALLGPQPQPSTPAAPWPAEPGGTTAAPASAAPGSGPTTLADQSDDAAGPAGHVHVVVAEDWATGQAASLRAGIRAAQGLGAAAVVVTLVDLPSLDPRAVARLLGAAAPTDPDTAPRPESAGPATLRQAAYDGRPGHPVVIGAAHFDALLAGLSGDTGARPYLRAHGVELVDCTDLGGGDDVDTLRAG